MDRALPECPASISRLASCLGALGAARWPEAEALWREELAARAWLQGPHHEETQQSARALAAELERRGWAAEASELAVRHGLPSSACCLIAC
mmetsp:Transcript_25000/g.68696  ORF Transcript_25000/g.68696 Transcript_25000/m.68696 type:complete len:92 (+) Transcript_25000:3-278(+)